MFGRNSNFSKPSKQIITDMSITDNCDIKAEHITVKHVPFIVVAIAVCFGLKGVTVC